MIQNPILNRLQTMRRSTLLMNAFYLMISTLVVAASGFAFWALVTRTYEPTSVGLATTLLSVSGLLSLLGLAGLDTTLVRFLPNSNRRSDYINSSFIIVTFTSGILAVCLGVVLPFISPSLNILSGDWAFLGFVFFTIVSSLNILTNAVFLAFKHAKYIFTINALFSIFKVALPLLAVRGNAMAIFIMAGSAQLLGLVLSIVWMKRKFAYRFTVLFDLDVLRAVKKFSFSVYASSILNLLPPTLLPLIIIFHTNPANAAYYYMAFTIAGVLYTVAYASMQSVFAEGSHDEKAMARYVGKAIKLVAALLLPAALVTALLSSTLLATFGWQYAEGAATLLQLFALGALPVAGYSALGAVFKITKNLRGIVVMNIVYAAIILGLSYLLVPHAGITAVGWAWVIGNIAACSVGALFLLNNKRLGG